MAEIIIGKVFHQRLKPIKHEFAYETVSVRVSMNELSTLRLGLFSVDKFNLFSLCSKDYLDGSKESLNSKIVTFFENNGFKDVFDIELQTFPRVWGFGFNPISFWYAYDKNHNLLAQMCEVNNTFGDRHYYLFDCTGGKLKFKAPKELHVSPFFPVKGEYKFNFRSQSVLIDYFQSQDLVFKSSISDIKKIRLSSKEILRNALLFPLSSFMIVYRIHWQGLKLFLKKVTFFKQPVANKDNLTKGEKI